MSNIIFQSMEKLTKDFRIHNGRLVSIGNDMTTNDWDEYYRKQIVDGIDFDKDIEVDNTCKLINAHFIDPLPQFFSVNPSTINILDAGCGIGKYTKNLIEQYKYNLFSVDTSQVAIDYVSKNINGNAQVEDFQSLSFNDDSFDMYMSNGILSYFDNIDKIIYEAFRVTKTFGIIFFKFSYLSIFKKIATYKVSVKKLEDGEQIAHYYYSIPDVIDSINNHFAYELVFFTPMISRSVETGVFDAMTLPNGRYLYNYHNAALAFMKLS